MKNIIIFLCVLLAGCMQQAANTINLNSNELYSFSEMVMKNGMSIEVQPPNHFNESDLKMGILPLSEKLTVYAKSDLTRCYTLSGETHCAKLIPRKERWGKSLGADYSGDIKYLKTNENITKAIFDEGQIHCSSVEEALSFLNYKTDKQQLYTSNGLVVNSWFAKDYNSVGGTLNVMVWQVYINGVKPVKLPGAVDDKISIKKEFGATQEKNLGSEYQEKVNKNNQLLFRQHYPYAGATGFLKNSFSNSTITISDLQGYSGA